MTTNLPASNGNSEAHALNADDAWTEEQIEEALSRLKLLHIKSRELRTIVPRMLEPLATKHTSPQDVLRSFQAAVTNASTELSDFRALYTSEESKKVLEQAKKSREADPKGIKPWRARDHPDWLDIEDANSG
ncbi:hypothetical protein BX600DRAFT_508951 [Xylariales sp. PMI_506]|nr:hypothetical protein BX600DRAFT_508951 [Xylariales sp. PMI_506]